MLKALHGDLAVFSRILQTLTSNRCIAVNSETPGTGSVIFQTIRVSVRSRMTLLSKGLVTETNPVQSMESTSQINQPTLN